MKILVTGATGNIGRMTVDHLIALGADDIRALSNRPERAGLPPQVEVVRGYLGRLESLPAAFEGVDRMYLAPKLETVTEVVELARRAGIRHIVDLSGDDTTDWQPIAQAVEKSGVAWTHLYAGEFMDNFEMWAEQIRRTGAVREPYPESANAAVAMDDIARVAATVLTQDGHAGATYTLTGPQTLTRAERVRQLGAVLGRELSFVTVSHEEAVALLEPMLGDFARDYVDGLALGVDHPHRANTTIADVTGRPATTFAEWAAAHADQFR
ncbi:NAD(P)H-binding protein [Nocardia sp. CDC159]|uniref:NAD(P)H-binding protein n=1 Tax=Nocardia pulmonis TaxID=2951408 RepID=A0A9X2IVZ1_9NOCA|nr:MULTISPECIES: NAD(P)H-binding protein [Nocardia]MCM6773723.1 NAD(P)H-binding protein [Nocardia pulmonis]MCM6786610.1 NAD(P)H-binding protein [Nocardia sp. CDC159]